MRTRFDISPNDPIPRTTVWIATIGLCVACSPSDNSNRLDTATDSEPELPTDTGIELDSELPPDADIALGDYGKRFDFYVIDPHLPGPAFASVGDFDGNGAAEIVISAFGNLKSNIADGRLARYDFEGSFSHWKKFVVFDQTSDTAFPNTTHPADIDGDGDLDLLLGRGFFPCNFGFLGDPCGAISWMENVKGAWRRHDISQLNRELFYHRAVLVDLNGDGEQEVVTIGENGPDSVDLPTEAQLEVYPRDVGSPSRFGDEPIVLLQGGGSLFEIIDVDGDGDLDIVSGEYFYDQKASYVWLEQLGPSAEHAFGNWERHIIADTLGYSIQLSHHPNLFGDGVARLVGSNHTNIHVDTPPIESAVHVLTPMANPRDPWEILKISEGIVSLPGKEDSPQHAPGIFEMGDVDGDGDIDIALSGDGDPRALVLEQVSPGQFETRVLVENLEQAGGMKITDLDGNGRNEIVVTGFNDNLVLLLEWRESR